MKKTATITDVAKMLNVSVSTVSRVMNNKDRVSPETRKKVLEAVKKLNYVPNYAAVSIVKKHTNVIVVILPNLSTRFFLSIVQGVEEVAKSKGYFTMVYSSNESSSEEYEFINGVMGRSVDGAIVVPSSTDLSFYHDYNKPVVFLDRFNDDYSFDSVVVDNFRGSYTATEHLIKNGHKKIGLITGPQELNIGKERYWGYEQALRDHKIEVDERYICISGWSEKDGYICTKKLLSMDDPPTAAITTNENLCRGFYKATAEMEIRLYDDISLVCFDDNLLAQLSRPQITVINRATNELGKTGAGLLLKKINESDPNALPRRVCLPSELIERGSVKRL